MNKQTPPEYGHASVLLQESIQGLDLHHGEIFLDGTLGSGGHSLAVAQLFQNNIKIIGLDMDQDALERATRRFQALAHEVDATFIVSNFRNIDAVLEKLGLEKVDKILLDLGLSSNQFEESGRGFSFQKDEPLTMTFKKDPIEEDVTAATIVNEWSEETLKTLIKSYGEEQFAFKIAKAIVMARETTPILTTHQLAEIIKSATPGWYHHRKTHYATKTFQALRITVNDELSALKEGLERAFVALTPGGRIAVISFHSLEDRIVKHFFKGKSVEGAATLITKRHVAPTKEEVEKNRRARSAKLRILEKK